MADKNKEDISEKRIQDFIKEYGSLTEKYDVDFLSMPAFIPDDKGGWKIVIHVQPIDRKEMRKKELDKAFVSK